MGRRFVVLAVALWVCSSSPAQFVMDQSFANQGTFDGGTWWAPGQLIPSGNGGVIFALQELADDDWFSSLWRVSESGQKDAAFGLSPVLKASKVNSRNEIYALPGGGFRFLHFEADSYGDGPMKLNSCRVSGVPGATPEDCSLTDFHTNSHDVIGQMIGAFSNGDFLWNGTKDWSGVAQYGLYRYLPNGNPDTTFGNGGIVDNVTYASEITISPTDHILLVSDKTIERRLGNGARDLTFGTAGVVTLSDSYWKIHYGYTLKADPSGNIFALLEADDDENVRYLILKLHSDGTTDTTFGDRGFAVLPDIGGAQSGHALNHMARMAISPSGNVVTVQGHEVHHVYSTVMNEVSPSGVVLSSLQVPNRSFYDAVIGDNAIYCLQVDSARHILVIQKYLR